MKKASLFKAVRQGKVRGKKMVNISFPGDTLMAEEDLHGNMHNDDHRPGPGSVQIQGPPTERP